MDIHFFLVFISHVYQCVKVTVSEMKTKQNLTVISVSLQTAGAGQVLVRGLLSLAPRHLQRGPGGVVRGGGRGVQGDLQRAGGTGEAGGQTQGPGAPGHARPDQSPRDSPAAPQTPGEHRWQKRHF